MRSSTLKISVTYGRFEYCKRILIWIGALWMQDNSYRGKPLLQGAGSERLYEDGAYDAFAVDEIGCRNGSYAVGFVGFVSAIKEERIGDIKIRAERGNITFWIAFCDATRGRWLLFCVLCICGFQE